jgi:pyochelin biosynthesis protein PchC
MSTTRSDSEFELWFRGHRRAERGAPRLLCLPHAGGAAGWYAPLTTALAPHVRALAVQYPGRQDRYAEPGPESIGALADRLFQILDGDGDGDGNGGGDGDAGARDVPAPTALFGHSMGAIVAFELARRLEAAGRAPAVLIVSGSRAPSATGSVPTPVGDKALVEELTLLGGTDASLLRDPELLKLFLPALRADYRALGAYHRTEGGPLSCPIVAMVGDQDPQVPPAEAEAWAAETGAGFELRVYPGGHFYLADQAAAVAAAIEDDLRRFGCLEAAASGDR